CFRLRARNPVPPVLPTQSPCRLAQRGRAAPSEPLPPSSRTSPRRAWFLLSSARSGSSIHIRKHGLSGRPHRSHCNVLQSVAAPAAPACSHALPLENLQIGEGM